MSVRSANELGERAVLKAVADLNQANQRRLLKTGARRLRIRRDMVGHTFDVFNGEKYIRVKVTDTMVNEPLGKYAPRGVSARVRYVSIPPRKMRFVARYVKGMPIQKAIDVLNFVPRVAAHHIAKTLTAAAANVLSLEGTSHLRPEDLYVKNISVDPAPVAKRIRFQSMGRVFRYRKRFSHMAVQLEQHPHVKVAETVAKIRETKTTDTATAGETAAKPRAAKAKTAKKTATKKKGSAKAKK